MKSQLNFFNSKKSIVISFLIIILLGSFVRLFQLSTVSIYGDELTIVYDTYSILHTGRDQLGNYLPITFEMGAGRPGGYIYGSLPFVALFGPDEYGVRMLSVLSGLGIIIASYYLIRGLQLSKGIGLILGVMLAFVPWAVNLSRGGFESHFALFLAITGLTCMLYVKQKPWVLLVTAFTIGISIHTYPTFKLTLPLMLLLFAWFVGAKDWISDSTIRKYLFAAISILSFFAIVSIFQTIGAGADSRFLSINIFNDETQTKLITENVVIERNLSETSLFFDQLFHNRYVSYPVIFLRNYFDNLSVRYLFLTGDFNPRHNMTQSGGFYIFEILTILIGIVALFFKQKRLLLLLLSWVLIAPIATSLLNEVHTLRNSLLFMPLSILSAVGLYTLIAIKNKKYLMVLLFIFVVWFIQFIFVYEKLYFVAPNLFSRHWAYPAKQLSLHIEREKNNYDYIIVRDNIDNIEYAYPTYARIDPNEAIFAENNRINLNNKRFKKLGNVYIGGLADTEAEVFLDTLPGSVLYFSNVDQMKTLSNYSIVTGKDNLVSYVVKEIHP